MKSSLKKIVAGVSVVSLVALNATFLNVHAAAGEVSSIEVNNADNAVALDTAISTIDFTVGTILEDTGKVVITYPDNFDDTGLTAGDITTTSTDASTFDDAADAVDTDKNTITLAVSNTGDAADATVTVAIAGNLKTHLTEKKNVLLYVNTKGSDGAADDKGAQMIYVGEANKVAVTASVAPILNMEIKATPYTITDVAGAPTLVVGADHHFKVGDSVIINRATGWDLTTKVNAINVAGWTITVDDATTVANNDTVRLADPYNIGFGTLSTTEANIRKLNIKTASNAVNGINVNMESTGLSTATHHIGLNGAGAAANDSTYTVSSTTVGTGESGTGIAVAQPVDLATNAILSGADNPKKATADTTVELKTTIGATTQAGNYSDTLTFTVTGNF